MKDNERKRICAFLKQHHVVTICAVKNNESWSASCFYALDEEAMSLLLLTEFTTRHGAMMLENPRVSGTVSSQPKMVSRIQGLQFSATARVADGERADSARSIYVHKFPVARMSNAPLWEISLDTAKFTDNRLGFGTKLIWTREEL